MSSSAVIPSKTIVVEKSKFEEKVQASVMEAYRVDRQLFIPFIYNFWKVCIIYVVYWL